MIRSFLPSRFLENRNGISKLAGTVILALLAAIAIAGLKWASINNFSVHAQGSPGVISVSAANYGSSVAPDSIVAAFGSGLASTSASATTTPLPVTLAGTTVRVKDSAGIERQASLFYVSPGQINYLMPAGTAAGTATVMVQTGNGPVMQGTADVVMSAPAIFTANADGQGVPASQLLRVKADGTQIDELPYNFIPATQKFVTRPIDLGPEGEIIYLILYGTGMRRVADPNGDGNLNENVHVIIGGVEIIPDFVGVHPYYIGLDQINVVIPRSMIGLGQIDVTVTSAGFAPSNAADIAIASPVGTAPPQVSGFNQDPVLAGQTITITGQGFSANTADNLVRISGIEARVISAAINQLTVQIPFGATSGAISVRTPQGETVSAGTLSLRTSISGIIETTDSIPLSGVKVRVADSEQEIFAITGPDGNFIIPDTPVGIVLLEVDPTVVDTDPPFVKVSLKAKSLANRDNPMQKPVSLQQASGPSLNVGSVETVSNGGLTGRESFSNAAITGSVETNGIKFEVPDKIEALFPDGATRGTIVLTKVSNSRVPASLPSGIFSADIAQITTFGVKLNPGGKLTFPNTDKLSAGTPVTLYKLDQTKGSNTLGSFIVSGAASVSADGNRIETETTAVTETSYFFAANQRPSATVTGRVVENDGTTPVRQATVTIRGQQALTDGNGSFIIRKVPATVSTQQVLIEASYLRPSGRVDRVQRNITLGAPGAITRIAPDLILPGQTTNRPPVILAPSMLAVTEGVINSTNIVATDPDVNQTITVSVAGAGFATISAVGNGNYTLRIAPGGGAAGLYSLTITARDSLNLKTEHKIDLTVSANRPPVLSVPGAQTALPGQKVSFNISATDPDAGQTLVFSATGLPAGSTLSPLTASSAQFSWTPTSSQVADQSITFNVTDNGLNPLSDTKTVLIQVKCPTIVLSPAGLPGGSAGMTYNQAITQTGGFGAVNFTLTGGSLPPGLNLTSAGVLSGTPTQTGSYNFLIKATDANGCAGMLSYSILIACPVITLSPEALPSGAPGAVYNQPVTASPAGGNYSFAVTSGSLPQGLSLNVTTGVINGMPAATGTFNFRLTATGFGSCSGSRDYTLTIDRANILVNSLDDSAVKSDGKCTLREALNNANESNETTGGDCSTGGFDTTIGFNVTGTINLSNPLPPIDNDLMINGPGSSALTIRRDKGANYAILEISASRIVSITGLTMRDGNNGGINNSGILTLTNCVVRNNTAPEAGADGGGINNSGKLTINGCLITENIANDAGGGIANLGNAVLSMTSSTISNNKSGVGGGIGNSGGSSAINDVVIKESTISGNSSSVNGSALWTDAGGAVSLINVTISSNSGAGSAIYLINSAVTATNSTIAFNTSQSGPGGINILTGIRVKNTIIANNTGPGGNCGGGKVANNDGNIQFPGSGCNDVIPVIDPLLAPLAANGGPTLTHLLLCGSPAIDKGISAGAPATDQRGLARPFNNAVDIGAVETLLTLSLAPQTLPNATLETAYNPQQLNASGGTGPYSFTVVSGLPGGMSLSSAGVLSGTPTVKGAFRITVMATDALGSQGCLVYALSVL
ncbi:MAG: putative Ig domain-containing protein [Acidobacteria bacterium]|nr:putative Ig domain-containing protein [Acidobacteriota bacterium]